MERKLSEVQKRYILIGIAVVLLIFIIAFMIFYRKKYEVTFNSNGGTQVVSARISEKDKIEKPQDPTKDGYSFDGWYYDDELYDFDTPIMHNMTLEAKWTPLGEAEIEGITLNQTELTVKPDETTQLVATFMPENAKIQKLLWSSSDESVATVDENGNVKALKEGSATITVKTEDEKHSATCIVTVVAKADDTTNNNDNNNSSNNNNNNNNNSNNNNSSNNNPTTSTQTKPEEQPKPREQPTTPQEPTKPEEQPKPEEPTKPEEQEEQKPTTVPVESVSISGNTQMYIGDKQKLTLTVNPSNATNKEVTWSSNSSSVTVDSSGNVTAVAAVEKATITATSKADSSKKASITITVKEKPANYVITLVGYKQEGTNNIMEYTFSVTKNGTSFNEYQGFEYNGHPIPRLSGKISSDWVNTSVSSAKITLNDETEVTATVRYK